MVDFVQITVFFAYFYLLLHSRIIKTRKNKAHEDFQWAFGLNRLSLDLIGVWPNNDVDSRGNRHLRIPIMLLWILFGILMPQLYALSKVVQELPLVIDNITVSFTSLISFIKLFLLWHSRQVFQPMISSVMIDWGRSKSQWEHGIMIKQARRARIFTISCFLVMFGSFVGFISPPIFGLSIRSINNITDYAGETRYFPLQSSYPFEVSRTPYFELIYITQFVASSFVAFTFTVSDNFFGALVFHACAQCEILGARMNQLLPMDVEHIIDWMRTEGHFFRLNLKRIVDTHLHIIRFIHTVEKSFNLIILTQAMSLTFIICCLGFGVVRTIGNESKSQPVLQIFTLSGTLLNLTSQMLVYCIACELLAKYSLGICDDIYCSGWYLLPARYSRDLIPIMVRSHCPLQLSAGKFFYLSLGAYLNIIKTSFGYISMLLAVSN